MSEWINFAREKIEQGKEDASVWYGVAARWFLLANILLYVASCIVGGGMVGPVRYIEFVYHCCHFEQAAQAVVTVSAAPNPCAGPAQTDSPKGHIPLKVVPESKF
jgi:hypothetical protein